MMRRSLLSGRRAQLAPSWVLVLALLPMLTFMGHWPATVSIPGTSLYVSIPLAGAEPHATHNDGGGEGTHDHSQHCHGDSASCSDVPALAGVSFALLGEAVALGAAGGMLLLAIGRLWRPSTANALAPGRRPPRIAPSHV